MTKLIAGCSQWRRYGQTLSTANLLNVVNFEAKTWLFCQQPQSFLQSLYIYIYFFVSPSSVSPAPQSGPQTSGGPRDYFRGCSRSLSFITRQFHNNTKILFTFSTILAFALMIQKQSWVKLPVPHDESRQWLRTLLIVTNTYSQFKENPKKPVSHKMSLAKHYKVLIKSQPLSSCLFNILWDRWNVCWMHFCCTPKWNGCLKYSS